MSRQDSSSNVELLNPGVVGRRRMLLAGAGAVASAAWLSGCSWLSTTPSGGGAESRRRAKGKEAPALADRVESGDLPALGKRLPVEPVVVELVEGVGQYGGEWDSTILGPTDSAWLDRTIAYENLLRWTPAYDEVIPNVAEEYRVEDGGRTFVFVLRRGLKWSDGAEFTSADIVFAYRDFLLNKEVNPEPYSLYLSGGKPAEVEADDDYTVRFTFVQPQSLFPYNLATPYAMDLTLLPRHYLEQFHVDYNDAIDDVVAESGAASWVELFLAKRDVWGNPELPRLHAWLPTKTLSGSGRLVAERNPYYFKVDPDGSQLPYIDSVVYTVTNEPELMVLKASNGEIDMQDRHINELENKPVLAQNRESGDYRLVDEIPTNSCTAVISLNLTHKDPVKREVFGTKDFRIGLSYAINREQIINAVFQRQGEPYHAAPRPDSRYFDEELAKQYTEYDVDKANEHLDRAGYVERDGEGFRLGPNGQRISFAVDARPEVKVQISALELIREDWRAVGVDMQLNSISRALFEERRLANEHDATVWDSEGGGLLEPILRTDWYFPSGVESVNYAPLWLTWYQTSGAEGEEPPADVRRQMELYDELKATDNEEQRDGIMREILAISKDFFYHIGVSLIAPTFAVVKNGLRNVPDPMTSSFIFFTPVSTNPQQWYFDE